MTKIGNRNQEMMDAAQAEAKEIDYIKHVRKMDAALAEKDKEIEHHALRCAGYIGQLAEKDKRIAFWTKQAEDRERWLTEREARIAELGERINQLTAERDAAREALREVLKTQGDRITELEFDLARVQHLLNDTVQDEFKRREKLRKRIAELEEKIAVGNTALEVAAEINRTNLARIAKLEPLELESKDE